MTLDGQIALVTGAGRGIGRAIALRLASEGAHVVLVARSRDELERLGREIGAAGGSSTVWPADITNDDDVRALVEGVAHTHGRLSILVNNAGIGRFGRLAELPIEDLDRMWALNVRAVFLLTQLALPLLRRAGGAVVQVASLAAKNAFVGGTGYAATKWALLGLSRSLMLEEREHKIRLITVCPGSVDTAFSSSPRDPAKAEKILRAEDVAQAVVAALLLPDHAMMSEIDLRPTNP